MFHYLIYCSLAYCGRGELIMLKNLPVHYAMLHCSKNAPIMLNKCPHYAAQIMLIKLSRVRYYRLARNTNFGPP